MRAGREAAGERAGRAGTTPRRPPSSAARSAVRSGEEPWPWGARGGGPGPWPPASTQESAGIWRRALSSFWSWYLLGTKPGSHRAERQVILNTTLQVGPGPRPTSQLVSGRVRSQGQGSLTLNSLAGLVWPMANGGKRPCSSSNAPALSFPSSGSSITRHPHPRLPVREERMLQTFPVRPWGHPPPPPGGGSTFKLAPEGDNADPQGRTLSGVLQLWAPGGRARRTGTDILTLRSKARARRDAIKLSLAQQSGKKEE